jgi:hypothetical protein
MVCSIQCGRASPSRAPTWRPISLPSCMRISDGIPLKPKLSAVRGDSSTLSLATLSLPPNRVAEASTSVPTHTTRRTPWCPEVNQDRKRRLTDDGCEVIVVNIHQPREYGLALVARWRTRGGRCDPIGRFARAAGDPHILTGGSQVTISEAIVILLTSEAIPGRRAWYSRGPSSSC